MTGEDRAEQLREFRHRERDEKEIRYRAHSPEDDLKISADDITSVSKKTGVSVSVSSQDSQKDSTTVSNPSERPIYRFRGGQWEQQTPEGSWELTDRFQLDHQSKTCKTARNFSQEDANILTNVTERFIDNYSGLERINQKRKRLEDELAEEQNKYLSLLIDSIMQKKPLL